MVRLEEGIELPDAWQANAAVRRAQLENRYLLAMEIPSYRAWTDYIGIG
jgi:hypothetical protein